jgi:hypothetical protein
MSLGIYNIFKAEILKKRIDLLNHTIKVALMSSAHTFDPSSHTTWPGVSADEISGNGYTAGGATLQGKTIGVDSNEVVFNANDVVWSKSSILAYHAVIYDDTTNPKYLIGSLDFGEQKGTSSSSFTIRWDPLGILRIG